MEKEKIKKTGNVVLNVLLYVFLALCILTVFLTVLSKKDSDGAAEIFGYQMRVVTSDSMSECELTDVSSYKIKDIPIRSLVFVEVVPDSPEKADEWYGELEVGDVLTFRYAYTTQVTITHRITSITEKDTGGYVIELAGDNISSDSSRLYQSIDTSASNSANYVIGRVTAKSYVLGVIMSFLMSPLGMILIIILPCLVIILLEVLKISRVLISDKRKREQEEMDKKESELNELRRKLEALESEKNGQDGADKGDSQ